MMSRVADNIAINASLRKWNKTIRTKVDKEEKKKKTDM
jgi:hypothetical protein